jgi:hypothetical protein
MLREEIPYPGKPFGIKAIQSRMPKDSREEQNFDSFHGCLTSKPGRSEVDKFS